MFHTYGLKAFVMPALKCKMNVFFLKRCRSEDGFEAGIRLLEGVPDLGGDDEVVLLDARDVEAEAVGEVHSLELR